MLCEAFCVDFIQLYQKPSCINDGILSLIGWVKADMEKEETIFGKARINFQRF